jgi:hypothetical protein
MTINANLSLLLKLNLFAMAIQNRIAIANSSFKRYKMKMIKKMDALLQLILITIFGVLVCLQTHEYFYLSYFTVGAIQFISAIAHLTLKWQVADKARKYYNISLSIIIAGTLTFLNPGFLLYYLYFLLFFSPIMAIYYFILSWYELIKLNERPLAILK